MTQNVCARNEQEVKKKKGKKRRAGCLKSGNLELEQCKAR